MVIFSLKGDCIILKFILIFIFILFIPIPIKFNIIYKEFIIYLKIYNKSIFNFDLRNISSYINIKNAYKENNKRIFFLKKYFKNKEINFKKLFKNLTSNKFKSFISVKTNIDFGISDAAICAIVYGFLWNLIMIIKVPLSLIFNTKDISLSINPRFNTNYLLFSINSIFYISLANIIYMIFLLLKSFINKEEITNE